MALNGEAIPRHLVFVLEGGEVVVQRQANMVESLETRAPKVFTDFERDHDITDEELQNLLEREIIAGFDEMTVWLPRVTPSDELSYYFLDTHLPPPYLPIVISLLKSADMAHRYTAKSYLERIAIMGAAGEPFSRLTDAEAALTLIQRAMGDQLPDLSINRIQVDPNLEDTQHKRPPRLNELLHTAPLTTIADRTILLVEDQPESIRFISDVLETLGVEVRQASSGEVALEILLDEEPDLALINLMLPDMHGYELIAKIRKDPLTANIPIIVLSAHTSQADVLFALSVAKVDEYLVKPIKANVLRHLVTMLLNRRL
jgi:CheY-like chemotaxis protein